MRSRLTIDRTIQTNQSVRPRVQKDIPFGSEEGIDAMPVPAHLVRGVRRVGEGVHNCPKDRGDAQSNLAR